MLTYFYVEGNYFSKQNKLVKKNSIALLSCKSL